jgi:hypothetical protein
MLVLFDQGSPVPLREFLREHTVRTAAEQGWTTLGNGQLLDAAEAAGFDVIVTTDKNMRHQQNVSGRKIGGFTSRVSRRPLPQRSPARSATSTCLTRGDLLPLGGHGSRSAR